MDTSRSDLSSMTIPPHFYLLSDEERQLIVNTHFRWIIPSSGKKNIRFRWSCCGSQNRYHTRALCMQINLTESSSIDLLKDIIDKKLVHHNASLLRARILGDVELAEDLYELGGDLTSIAPLVERLSELVKRKLAK